MQGVFLCARYPCTGLRVAGSHQGRAPCRGRRSCTCCGRGGGATCQLNKQNGALPTTTFPSTTTSNNPRPSTSTRHPTTDNLNPQPSTRHPQPDTRHPQHSRRYFPIYIWIDHVGGSHSTHTTFCLGTTRDPENLERSNQRVFISKDNSITSTFMLYARHGFYA